MARSSSRFTRIKKPLKSEMNVVPYIDVMLVLLVIFMVTAPMITSGISVDLPQAKSQAFESKEPPAIVTIDAKGQYYLSYKDQDETSPLSLTEIQDILTEANTDESKVNVLVNGDQAASYGQVMQLMSNLQEAGLEQVGLLTKPLK